MTKAAVLGAGSWGTTFAKVLSDGGADVAIWARRPELAREISQSKRNSDYLPGINLPRGLWASSNIPEVLDGAEQVYLSVPSQSLRENLRIMRDLVPREAIVVSLMKGVEKGTGSRMSEIIREELRVGPDRIAVVSGPNLALEIAKEQPTASVVSSEVLETARLVAMTATNPYLRSFVNTDVIGTEFGGVLKNLIAVAIGIVDGVGYGENTKASIITRGLVEITDFAVAHGARAETLSGLAGLGDLIATCESSLSRNNTALPPARPGLQLLGCREDDEPDRRGSLVGRANPRARAREGRRDADREPGRGGAGRYAESAGPRAPLWTTDDRPQGE